MHTCQVVVAALGTLTACVTGSRGNQDAAVGAGAVRLLHGLLTRDGGASDAVRARGGWLGLPCGRLHGDRWHGPLHGLLHGCCMGLSMGFRMSC